MGLLELVVQEVVGKNRVDILISIGSSDHPRVKIGIIFAEVH